MLKKQYVKTKRGHISVREKNKKVQQLRNMGSWEIKRVRERRINTERCSVKARQIKIL